MTRNIADELRAQLGASVRLPMPDDNAPWHRFDCPFCGKDRAVINYRADWFECYRCKTQIILTDHYALENRHKAQINQAVRSAARRARYGMDGYAPRRELRNYALERLWVYAGPPRQGDCDAGKLWDWEMAVKGDPDQLDRYVLQALNCDMLDFRRKLVRRNEKIREHEFPVPDVVSVADSYGENADLVSSTPRAYRLLMDDWEGNSTPRPKVPAKTLRHAEPPGDLGGYPLLQMTYRDQMTQAEMAEALGVSVPTIKRRVKAELQRYKDDHGIKV